MYNAEKSGATMNVREEVLKKCWDYLNINFSKFSESNKIRIALELGKKGMPTQIEADIKVTKMENIELGGRLKEYALG